MCSVVQRQGYGEGRRKQFHLREGTLTPYNDRFPLAFTICKPFISVTLIMSYISVVPDLSNDLLVLCSGSRLPPFMSRVAQFLFFLSSS